MSAERDFEETSKTMNEKVIKTATHALAHLPSIGVVHNNRLNAIS